MERGKKLFMTGILFRSPKMNFFPTPLLNKATRGETEVEKKSATRLSSSETEKCVFNV